MPFLGILKSPRRRSRRNSESSDGKSLLTGPAAVSLPVVDQLEKKLEELNMLESSEYNQSVLSDLSDQTFPENFLEIQYTYAIPDGFIFVTEQYDHNLETYLKSKVIEEKEALSIFREIIKSVFSTYTAGFWHRNVRPEHFVKVKNTWKMESLVYNESNEDAEGYDSEYLWNSAYQPPEAYGRYDF